ncbi:MAG: hypothetical protein Q3990_07335 [Desulfovibrionaceae bacterium]|nr:hypothetical protein [Desulfovibrionaceae bacterium]
MPLTHCIMPAGKNRDSAEEKTMRARFLGKIAIAVFLAASLSLPAYVSAEELAPGLNACLQKNIGREFTCYYDAEVYWREILQENYKEAKLRAVQKTGNSRDLFRFRWAFEQYLNASHIIKGNNGSYIFRIEETKKMARLMTTLYR